MSPNYYTTKAKIFLLSLLIISSFFVGQNCFGSPKMEQTFDVVTLPTNYMPMCDNYYQKYKFQNSGVIDSLIMERGYSGDVAPGNDRLRLHDRTVHAIYYFNQTNTTSIVHPYAHLESTSTVTVDNTHSYEWYPTNCYWRARTPSTTYTNSSAYDESGVRTSFPDGAWTTSTLGGGWDFYIHILFNDVTYPSFVATPTTTCDFKNWAVNTYIGESDLAQMLAQGWSAQVAYRTSTTEYTMWDNYGGIGSASYNWEIPKADHLSASEIYYAQLQICDRQSDELCQLSEHIIYSSTEWSFYLSGEANCSYGLANNPGQYPSAVSSSLAVSITCNKDDGIFDYALCSTFTYLFSPNIYYLELWQNLGTQLSVKPPFGYFTVYSAQIASLENSGSTTPAMSTSTFSFLPEITVLMTFPFFNTLLNIVTIIIWIAFLWYLYGRFKNLSLHG